MEGLMVPPVNLISSGMLLASSWRACSRNPGASRLTSFPRSALIPS